VDAAGDSVVSWRADRADGSWDLYLRRYGPDGAPLTDPIRVTPAAEPTGGWKTGALAVGAAGDVLAAWSDYGSDGDGWGVAARRYAAGATTTDAYDGRDRLTGTTDPLGNTTRFTYDAAGDRTGTTDALGHTTTVAYDALNRPTAVTDAAGGVTAFTYDAAGNLATLTDPDNNVTTYAYDELNRRTTETDPRTKVTTTHYNANGLADWMVDRDGRKRAFTYDLLGRRTAEVWLDGANNPIYEADHTYDLAGQMLTASDDHSSYAYTYDLLGRVTSEDNAGTPGAPHVVLSHTYDADGNHTGVSGNLGGAVTSTYTDLNQLATTGLTTSGVVGSQVAFAYDGADRLAGVTRQDGTTGPTVDTAYGYDLTDRLTGITHTSSAAGQLSQFAYGYDDANRLTSYTGPDGSLSYAYDATDQLTGVSGARSESFTYDPNGNRTMTGYSTGTGNRLLSDGTNNYTYDDEGNTLTQTRISDGQVTSFAYDYRNRLTDVQTKTAGGTR
jgi:YD repeat-containing protein